MDGSASGLSDRQHASSILILPASVRWFCCAATGRARVRCRPVCWKAGWDTDGRQKRETALRCEVVLPERLDVPADFLSSVFRVDRKWVGVPVPASPSSSVMSAHRRLLLCIVVTPAIFRDRVLVVCVCVCVCMSPQIALRLPGGSRPALCAFAVSRKLAATRKAVASWLACVASEDGVRSWRYAGTCVMLLFCRVSFFRSPATLHVLAAQHKRPSSGLIWCVGELHGESFWEPTRSEPSCMSSCVACVCECLCPCMSLCVCHVYVRMCVCVSPL